MVAITRFAFALGAALSLGVVLIFGTAPAAFAVPSVTPTPTPIPTMEDAVVTYIGPATWTYDHGGVDHYERKFGADCSSGTCFLFIDQKIRIPTNVEVIDGYAAFELPSAGELCSEEYEWSRSTTASFEGVTATLTQIAHGAGDVTCPDGSSNRYVGSVGLATGVLVSGNPCFITNTCPKAEPITSPTAIAAVNPVLPFTPSRTIDEPSILSTLPTADTAVTLRNAVWATAMAVILAILVALPKHLLSSAASTGSKRLAKWGEKLTTTSSTSWKRFRGFVARITSIKGWGAAAIGITIAAIISSFIDPEFGWNAASIRTAISILVSLALQIVTGWLLLIWLVRRTHPTAKPEFEFRPLTLLIVVGAVILSRLTEFEPGIIFGLVAGLSFAALSAIAERARVAFIGLARAFVLSLFAWFGYSLMAPTLHGGPVVVFITETLSSLTIAGIVALPIALIPFRGTTGDLLWKWNRWTWVGSYVVGLIGFFLILMPMPFSWKEVPLSLATWVGLFVAYSVGSIILWAIIVRPWEKEKPVPVSVATGATTKEASDDTGTEKSASVDPVPEEAG